MGFLHHIPGDLLKALEPYAPGHLCGQVAGLYTVDIFLPHGQYLRHDQVVGKGQGLGEVVQECVGAGIGVGLEHSPDLPIAHTHGRGQHGGELGGVVGEVVRYGDPLKLPEYLKAPVHAPEMLQRGAYFLSFNAQGVGCCCGGQGVEHIVPARDSQIYPAQGPTPMHEGEILAGTGLLVELGRVVVAALLQAKGDYLFIKSGHGLHNAFVLGVHHQQPVGLHSKLPEGLDNILKGLEIVQVVRLNIQQQRHRRVQLQKGVHIFTGLTDDGIAAAHTTVAVDKRQLAADNGAGVRTGFDEYLGEHGGGGGLTVGAGYR